MDYYRQPYGNHNMFNLNNEDEDDDLVDDSDDEEDAKSV